MPLFWKSVGATLITLILALTLERQSKDFSLILTLTVSCLLAAVSASFLEPVTAFLDRLQQLGDLNSGVLLVLMKALGVGLTGEIASSVCSDGGSSALGKALRFLANSVIFYLSIPVFTSLIDLINELL